MSSEKKASDRKAILWDAERLARFANADDRQAVEDFRVDHADVFPPSFWNMADLPIPGDLFFGADSSEVHRALGLAEPSKLAEAENSIQVPAWWAMRSGLRGAWQEHFPLDRCVAIIAFRLEEEPFPAPYQVWPFQRAVMFLGIEPWRAKFCGTCGKRFVADKPARRFCSSACFGEARKTSRNSWWAEYGKDWRQKRTKRRHKKSKSRS